MLFNLNSVEFGCSPFNHGNLETLWLVFQASGKPTIRRLDPRPSPNKGKSVRHVIGKYAIF